MTGLEELTKYIKKLSVNEVNTLLDAANSVSYANSAGTLL